MTVMRHRSNVEKPQLQLQVQLHLSFLVCLVNADSSLRLTSHLSSYRQLVSELFPVAATKIWNSLPDNVVSASHVNSLIHQLKTFLCSSNHSAAGTLWTVQ